MAEQSRPVLRIAHLTDVHLEPDLCAPEGFANALEQAQCQSPDVLFMGGDLVSDSLEADPGRTSELWGLYRRVLDANLRTPVEHCLGNHDVWGWNRRSTYEHEPRFGKRWALDVLELEKPYRSFDRAGWHFVVLDSTHPLPGDGYTARLDDEQFEWLASDLAGTPAETPVLVLSHIPIFAACPFLHGKNEATGEWCVPGAWMHLDVRRIQALFAQHPNVKLCLSGHMHLVDQVLYRGVTYCCNGAVCGSWWKGDFLENPSGYALVDLYDDGSWKNTFVPIGWQRHA